MNDIDFYSSSSYIFLPTKNNPKVALAIDNSTLSKNSFKLYNPFSRKAKLLKSVLKFSSRKLNFMVQVFTHKKVKSNFVEYLEELLKQPLVVSVYFSTINDKVVMQLQSKDAKVLGYLKYPLNDIGLKHTNNEIKAFDILSSKKIIEPYILSQLYDGKPFLFLKELDGIMDTFSKKDIETILMKFQREQSYKLSVHPRVGELKALLLKNDMKSYIVKLEKIVLYSTLEYRKVYEHGDFAPWNIVKIKDEYIPFDFEYFVEDGLEYFDIIKYYYQIGKLLENKRGKQLIEYIITHINIKEIKVLLGLFLIKEIVRGKEENESFEFEENIMEVLETL